MKITVKSKKYEFIILLLDMLRRLYSDISKKYCKKYIYEYYYCMCC